MYLGGGIGAELYSTPGLAPWASLGALRRGMCALGVRVRRRWIGKHETRRLWGLLPAGAAMSMGGNDGASLGGGTGATSVGVAGHAAIRLTGGGEGIGGYCHYRTVALGIQGRVLGREVAAAAIGLLAGGCRAGADRWPTARRVANVPIRDRLRGQMGRRRFLTPFPISMLCTTDRPVPRAGSLAKWSSQRKKQDLADHFARCRDLRDGLEVADARAD